jgi:hypothetical protein
MAAKLLATARKLPPGPDRHNILQEIGRFRAQIVALLIVLAVAYFSATSSTTTASFRMACAAWDDLCLTVWGFSWRHPPPDLPI